MKAKPSVFQRQVEYNEEDGLEGQDGDVDSDHIPVEWVDVDILVEKREDVRLNLVDHDENETFA